jgi:hypothetical protein
MTRRIDWRDGATKADLRNVENIDDHLRHFQKTVSALSANRKRIIARCYQKAARAKGRKG